MKKIKRGAILQSNLSFASKMARQQPGLDPMPYNNALIQQPATTDKY
ncbi:hypothetical protein [Pseudomonas lundensis]|nr:hypothetical protein [Pseudomonas lundensis]NNA02943.1 hypothetical protein [Pseudomonas lundensis]